MCERTIVQKIEKIVVRKPKTIISGVATTVKCLNILPSVWVAKAGKHCGIRVGVLASLGTKIRTRNIHEIFESAGQSRKKRLRINY